MWPKTEPEPNNAEDSTEEPLNIEDQIAKEVRSLKQPQTEERLFSKPFSLHTWISLSRCQLIVKPTPNAVRFLKVFIP